MIIETIIDGKRFASIALAGKQTIQDLKYEIILLKGIYGRSDTNNSRQLDEYLRNNKSVLGLNNEQKRFNNP